MALTRNFKAESSIANKIDLTWDQPLGFNNTNDELIITRTISHYPMELFNTNFPDKATDSRPIEIYRGRTLVGIPKIFSNTTSVNFPGGEHVEISNDPLFRQTDNISAFAWIKTTDGGSGHDIFGIHNFGATRRKWMIGITGGELRIIVSEDGGVTNYKEYISLNQNINDDQWHLVGFTFSSNTLKMYIDGQEITGPDLDKNVDGTVNSLFNNTTDPVLIGAALNNTVHSNFYIGLADEITYWDKDLTSAEVSELYNFGQVYDYTEHSTATNLIELYRFDGDTLPTITGSVNNLDGTATSGVSLSSTVPPSITQSIVVSGNTLTDTNANFSSGPSLIGRLLRDSSSQVFKIISHTDTELTLDGEPQVGKYVILPDFPTEIRAQENYEEDIRTEAGPGFIKNLVIIDNQSLVLKEFEEEELVNLVFVDGNGDKFIIKSNTSDTIFFWGTSTPVIGVGMRIINSFNNSQPRPYTDSFRTENDASTRTESNLRDDTFYYYTVFTKPEDTNVAQAEFATIDSGVTTQDEALSIKDRSFGDLLYSFWPSLHRELDTSGDLQDLMKVFGFQFNQIHSLIETYKLQDADNVLVSAVLPLSEQTGLPSVGFSIGADTLRRIARDMIGCWKLKGSKEGIALFIRKLTTWDITNGTADFAEAIQDFLPNVTALRFFDPNLGSLNVRLTQTSPTVVEGGRFARSLPGIVIPGFFTFREFVITLKNVALFAGESESFSLASGTTTMTDSTANFGVTDSLVGNFLIPNTEEVNDIFEIVANTSTTITVRGIINNRNPAGNYAVLSPLNTNRFIILNSLLPVYIPFGTKAGFIFV